MDGVQPKVIGGRVYLIPPKGMLSDLQGVAESKFNGGEFKYITEKFKMPSEKARFEIEVVVDDDCDVCPVAVEMMSELAARFDNVVAKIYNITYVKSPFEPVTATPTFRINRVVKFIGIPLDPDSVNKFFFEHLKKAYVVSHPKLQWLIERIKRYAEMHGYMRNPNEIAYMNLLYRLLKNLDEYGYPYCPCRPLKKKPGMTKEQIYELNKDKICPCVYAPTDIKTRGHCLCGLYWTKEKVNEYVTRRLQRYGWIIKEIDSVQKALEELKKRIVSGGGKQLTESIVNKLQEIYVALPD